MNANEKGEDGTGNELVYEAPRAQPTNSHTRTNISMMEFRERNKNSFVDRVVLMSPNRFSPCW